MISLSADMAILVYLAMTLLLILSIWSFQHFKSRSKSILTSEQQLNMCEYCHFAYLANERETVTQCPQCSSFNKKKK